MDGDHSSDLSLLSWCSCPLVCTSQIRQLEWHFSSCHTWICVLEDWMKNAECSGWNEWLLISWSYLPTAYALQGKTCFPTIPTACVCVCVCVKVTQLCLTLCNPMDCSLAGSSVHGILQERRLEWVPVPFSRGSSEPRDQTQDSCISGRFLTFWAMAWVPMPVSMPSARALEKVLWNVFIFFSSLLFSRVNLSTSVIQPYQLSCPAAWNMISPVSSGSWGYMVTLHSSWDDLLTTFKNIHQHLVQCLAWNCRFQCTLSHLALVLTQGCRHNNTPTLWMGVRVLSSKEIGWLGHMDT